MKLFLTLILCFQTIFVFAIISPADSLKKKRFREMHITINALEVGGLVEIQSDLNTGNEMLDQYLNARKKGFQGAISGVTLYYKQIGLGIILNDYTLVSEPDEFRQYLTDEFPNYYVPNALSVYGYSLSPFSLNLSYQKHFKYLYIEPKFRFGVIGLRDRPQGFTLKEKGSNQFVSYQFDNEKKNKGYSYHFCFDIGHQFKKRSFPFTVQAGLHAEFMMAPVKYRFVIEETSYLYPSTNTHFELTAWNTALAFSAFLNFAIGK